MRMSTNGTTTFTKQQIQQCQTRAAQKMLGIQANSRIREATHPYSRTGNSNVAKHSANEDGARCYDCIAILEIQHMDNPNANCAPQKCKYQFFTVKEQHQMPSDERCNPTVGQMAQTIFSEITNGQFMTNFKMALQVYDWENPQERYTEIVHTERVEHRGFYKVLLSPKKSEQIERFLLSGVAPLANIYNAITDTFVTSNDHGFFRDMFNRNNLNVQNLLSSQECVYEMENLNDIKERTKILCTDQKLSVISHLALLDSNVSPLGQFLLKAAHGNSFGIIKILQKKTYTLRNNPEVRNSILKQLPNENATHFVASASYGLLVVVTFTFNEESAAGKVDISTAKRIAKKMVDGGTLINSEKSCIDHLNNSILCNVFVDPSVGNCASDLSFLDGINFFTKCCTKEQEHPIAFTLVPLSDISDKFPYRAITMIEDESQIERVLFSVQQMNAYNWDLQKIEQSLVEYSYALTNEQLDDARRFLEQNENAKKSLFNQLKIFIVELRMGKTEYQNEKLEKALAEYLGNNLNFIDWHEKFMDEKMKFIQELKQKCTLNLS